MKQHGHKTEVVNRIKTVRFYPFVFTSNEPRNGKRIPQNTIKYNEQRDEETGYGYFGARYMDHELMTMWLSVDPLADKYPSISPYAYCAWNPVKLVDPDGREVEYSSFYDWARVSIERLFNKSFRIRFNDLKNSNETYVFNYNTDGVNKLSTDGEKLYINYSLDEAAKKEGATTFSLLRHETEHAVQFEYGEVGFVRGENGKWLSLNFDINDELKARDFEASGFFNVNAQAIQNRWNRHSDEQVGTRELQIYYLRNNCKYRVPDGNLNNTAENVGKNNEVFALKHRSRDWRYK